MTKYDADEDIFVINGNFYVINYVLEKGYSPNINISCTDAPEFVRGLYQPNNLYYLCKLEDRNENPEE